MKQVFFLIAFVVCAETASCQGGGFNRLYSFSDNYASIFYNLALNSDTFMVYGGAYIDASLPYEGIVLASLDTFGSLLDQSFYYLPDDDMLAEPGFDIIKLQDGGYAAVGTLFYDRTAYLTKFSHAGEVVSNKFYSLKNTYTMWPRHLIELNDGGFLMGGFAQRYDYTHDNFVKHIGPAGNQIWSETYGTGSDSDAMRSFIKTDDNTFVIGGGKYAHYNASTNWTKSRIYAIDSLGNIKWDWYGPVDQEGAVYGLHKTADGGWIYLTPTNEPNPIPDPVETYVSHIKVVRRDSAFNLLWERTLSPVSSYWNSAGDLEATPDGNWVATGWWLSDTYKTCFYKISDQGDSLWCTCLTPPDNTEGVVEPGGIIVLPSGSTICTARYDKYVPGPAKTYGWLIKVDNDGCVDTLCELSAVLSPPPALSQKVLAYPNPATSKIVIASDLPFKRQTGWYFFDVFGRVLRSGIVDFETKNIEIDLGGLAEGLYFWQVTTPDGLKANGRFLKI